MSTFRTSRRLAHPPELVWRALTEAGLLGRWFMESDTDLTAGATFELRDPEARGWSGRLTCTVEDFRAPHRLRYRAVEVDGPSETVVSWTLTPQTSGTLLELEHAGWQGVRGWLTGMALKLGWASLLRKRLPVVLRDLRTDG